VLNFIAIDEPQLYKIFKITRESYFWDTLYNENILNNGS